MEIEHKSINSKVLIDEEDSGISYKPYKNSSISSKDSSNNTVSSIVAMSLLEDESDHDDDNDMELKIIQESIKRPKKYNSLAIVEVPKEKKNTMTNKRRWDKTCIFIFIFIFRVFKNK